MTTPKRRRSTPHAPLDEAMPAVEPAIAGEQPIGDTPGANDGWTLDDEPVGRSPSDLVPSLSPAQILGGFALLAAAVVLLRRRRRGPRDGG